MTLTQKETSLLNDLKTQEQLCIDKYTEYEKSACSPELKTIFGNIKKTEESHLSTVTKMLGGEEVKMPDTTPEAKPCGCMPSSCSDADKKHDKFLCQDALATEKHVSSLYNTSVFEFTSPIMRDTLAHIQKEEQNHGETLYSYMSVNGMY